MRVSSELDEQVGRLAAERDCDKADIVRDAINRFLASHRPEPAKQEVVS